MIELANGNNSAEQERHEATIRKQKQLDDAEKEFQKNVAEDEAEEAAK